MDTAQHPLGELDQEYEAWKLRLQVEGSVDLKRITLHFHKD